MNPKRNLSRLLVLVALLVGATIRQGRTAAWSAGQHQPQQGPIIASLGSFQPNPKRAYSLALPRIRKAVSPNG